MIMADRARRWGLKNNDQKPSRARSCVERFCALSLALLWIINCCFKSRFSAISVRQGQGYSKYPPQVWPLIEKYGGAVTHRISDFEIVEGDWCPKRMLIVEFPDKAAAKAFMDDPDYQPLKELRLRTATSLMVLGNSEM